MKKIKPVLSYSRLEQQLKTWKRENREIYNQIIGLGQMFGAITKTGKVSTNKRNLKYYNQFIKVYQDEVGSFTSFKKKFSQKNVKFKKPKGMTQKEYSAKAYSMTTDLQGFFEKIYRLEGKEKAIEEYDTVKVMDIDQAEDYMNNKLRELHDKIDTESSIDAYDSDE